MGLEDVLGGEFQVFSVNPSLRQCERFLQNIRPGLCPGYSYSQCDYTINKKAFQLSVSMIHSDVTGPRR